jgi:hypothetical protein
LKIISLYKKHTSFFLYGAFAFSILLWIGYGHITKYGDMLEEPVIYLNLDGSFKSEKVRDLERNKKDLFWKHQLEQVEKNLKSDKNSIDFNYDLITRENRQLRDQLANESYLEAIRLANSDIERISLRNSFQVLRAENQAKDLKADNDYYLRKLIIQDEIKGLESLRDFINSKITAK